MTGKTALPRAKRPGRARRYETPEQMQAVVDAYFASAARPTVSGLALALGFTNRQSLLNYERYGPEFRTVVQTAKLRIEDHYERMLQNRTANTAAAIFALKNLGWRAVPEPVETQLPPIQVICKTVGPAGVAGSGGRP